MAFRGCVYACVCVYVGPTAMGTTTSRHNSGPPNAPQNSLIDATMHATLATLYGQTHKILIDCPAVQARLAVLFVCDTANSLAAAAAAAAVVVIVIIVGDVLLRRNFGACARVRD